MLRWKPPPPPPPSPQPPTIAPVALFVLLAALALIAIVMLLRRLRITTPSKSSAVSRSERSRRWQVESGTVRAPDGRGIDVKIYTPDDPIAACVFAHGGCFHDGTCDTHPAVSAALASLGIASVSSSYRQGAAHPHPAAQRDLASVADHVRERWAHLPFGVVGSSSGGWHALMLARALPAPVRFCVALCPVAHPQRRAEYLKACIRGDADAAGYSVQHPPDTASSMLTKQTGYWGGAEEAMQTAGEALLCAPERRVPTLLVLGSQDKNVPHQVTAGVQGWADRTVVLGGRGHEIQDTPPETHSWEPDVERFLREHI